MRRMLWLGIGLAIGGLVVRAAARKAQAFTPQGMVNSARGSAVGLASAVREFVDDVRLDIAEREAELHEALASGTLGHSRAGDGGSRGPLDGDVLDGGKRTDGGDRR